MKKIEYKAPEIEVTKFTVEAIMNPPGEHDTDPFGKEEFGTSGDEETTDDLGIMDW